MSQFHRERLLSGIRKSHKIPVHSDWAYAIRKQARLSLLPLFRDILLEWKLDNGIKRPYLTELGAELFRGFFSNGEIPQSVRLEAAELVSRLVINLDESDKLILKFYFLSEDENLEFLAQEQMERMPDDLEEVSIEKLDRLAGKSFLAQYAHFSELNLERYILEELSEIENIISGSDLEMGLDVESITRINEGFSDYLDISVGEISLIPIPIEEFDFWKKVTSEELETVGKRFHASKGLEWAECWLLPNGEIKAKGNVEDPGDRDKATIEILKRELPILFRLIHEALKERYQLLDNQIHYSFSTRKDRIENILPREGIDFFVHQVKTHGVDDFEPVINIAIRRYQDNRLEEWGTQISLCIDDRFWQTEDESYEFKVWVFSIVNEEILLETRFTEDQKETIVQEILRNISESYPHRNEA